MARHHYPRSHPLIVQGPRALASRRGIRDLDGRRSFAGPPGGWSTRGRRAASFDSFLGF